ncbi:NAD(P)/FAD-dependent oxidoreductase [cf. Phormidesmis sp. LEGE 11477]|uniref:FAD-dependent oxidoreductase n=1 Tax=cf. Phormidesmis sp. LEGE 11477 TaxID=1828680 RepID=UPI0018815475|nr:FAD-binding oxidoreductase [cf. Phormidesmis sp. LEGE 11477]MBE9063589.1 FAD-binding oxidoreductase [cf. Phormidesmis sp. LEGE 11477]
MDEIKAILSKAILSKIEGNPWKGLQKADELWSSYKAGDRKVQSVVTEADDELPQVDYDVAICGGTLGILLAATLAQRGWQVALLERGTLRGRDQEWNISRRELDTFVRMGLLNEAELERAIASQYNPARIAFNGGKDLWVEDVLNIGVDPVSLLEQLKQKFVAAGGTLLEQTPFKSATVHPNGVAIQTNDTPVRARLLVDAMGHFSPIVQQARAGKKPDAVCLVVGTCATGYEQNESGDLIVSFTPIQKQCQYFWEAFPARDGRTTYLFTYLDAHPSRLSLTDLFEDYFELLPQYQNVSLEQLEFARALFGFFPCYKDSPLQYKWDRTLPIGDSSGSQSPLSFGGFGAMVRHLERLAVGVDDALQADLLDAKALGKLQPYQPNLSATWLFQKSMSVGIDQTLAPNKINQVLQTIFDDMAALGNEVLLPFLQDVVQFPPLAKTMLRTSTRHPGLVLSILPQVGVGAVASWTRHFVNLGLYSLLDEMQSAVDSRETSDKKQYYADRWRDAVKYGSGSDYEV